MMDKDKTLGPILKELEAIQAKVGNVQLSLLELMVELQLDSWDDAIEHAIIRLEAAQRGVGEVQVSLLRQTPDVDLLNGDVAVAQVTQVTQVTQETQTINSAEVATVTEAKTIVARVVPQENLGPYPDLREWITRAGIQIRGAREESGIDGVADQLARFLGDNFAVLAPFYGAIKQRVSGGFNKWFSVKDLPPATISTICQFGAKLHRSGFLSNYKHVKDDKVVLFVPLEDDNVRFFLTGGWMERYVALLIEESARRAFGTWSRDQMLLGTLVTLPDKLETELDTLVGLPGNKVLWIECKTGSGWQSYIPHFQKLNHRFLHLPPAQAALVLLEPLTEEEKSSVSTLAGMTALHLTEFSSWLNKNMGGM